MMWLVATAQGADFFEGYGFYLGDPHVHTGQSADGASSDLNDDCPFCGAFADVTDIARRNGLDFVSISEHVNGEAHATAAGFDAVVQATRDGHDPKSGFLTIMGAELWFRLNGAMIGHKNLYIFADNESLETLQLDDVRFDQEQTDIDNCDDIWTWAASIEEDWGSAVLVPHHPAMSGEMATDWSCHATEAAQHYSPVAEIYSRHGNSDWIDARYDPLWMDYHERGALGFAMDPKGLALRLGFFGGTDGHDTNPGAVCEAERYMAQHPYGGGLTIAVIPEEDPFDREQLHQAVLSRQTYATSGPLLPAVVRYASGGSYLGGMGEVIGLPGNQPLEVALNIPAELAPYVLDVVLVGPGLREALSSDGAGGFSLLLAPEDVPAWAYPELALDGEDWYGSGGCSDGGEDREERIWLSPTWFETTEADLDGDGFSWAEGDCDDGNASIHPGAQEDCTSGVDEDCDGDVDGDDADCQPADTGAVEADTAAAEDTPAANTIGTIAPADGCSTTPAAPVMAVWGLLALLNRRRP